MTGNGISFWSCSAIRNCRWKSARCASILRTTQAAVAAWAAAILARDRVKGAALGAGMAVAARAVATVEAARAAVMPVAVMAAAAVVLRRHSADPHSRFPIR